MRKSITTTAGKITVETGSEGPSWDPCSFVKTTLKRPDGMVITCHMGLVEYVQVDGKTLDLFSGTADELFEELAGFHPNEVEHWFSKARGKCRKCGCKKGEWCNGYPGESLKLCCRCGACMDYDFDEAAII